MIKPGRGQEGCQEAEARLLLARRGERLFIIDIRKSGSGQVAARKQEPVSSWPGEVRSCSSEILVSQEVARWLPGGRSQAPPGQEL